MKLEKLLKSNSFLINSSLCLVLLLCLCYLGISSPVKKTYSADSDCWINIDGETICEEEGQLLGEYRWNDNITDFSIFSSSSSSYSETYMINFTSNNKSFDRMRVVNLNNTSYSVKYNLGEDGSEIQAFYVLSSGTSHNDSYRNLIFETSQSVNSEFYSWFISSATPVNKCYYNSTTGEYKWTNVPSFGNETTHQEKASCENQNGYKKITFSTVYGGHIKGSIYHCQEYYDDGFTCYEYNFNGDTTYVRSMMIGEIYDLSVRDDFEVSWAGHKLIGWNTKFDGSGTPYALDSKITVNEDITLYAQWEEIKQTYTITFEANGGIVTPETVTVNDGESILTLPTLEREGYNFLGWYTSATADTQIIAPFTPTNNMTLYARWEEIKQTYTITFEANGGIVTPETVTVNDGESILTLPTLEREGYIFLGWYTSATADTQIIAPFTPTNNMTLYARWEEIKGEVVFDNCHVEGKYIFLDFNESLSNLSTKIKVTPDTYKVNLPSKIATGAKITILNASNEKYDEYTIVAYGDVNTDGELNVFDFIDIYNYLSPSKEQILIGEYLLAADYDKSSKVNVFDLIDLYNYLRNYNPNRQ